MDRDEAQDDPFGVQLEWPDEHLAAPFEPPARDPSTDASAPAAAPTPADPGDSAAFVPPAAAPAPVSPQAAPASGASALGPATAGLDDDAHVDFARVVARIDALTAATTTFRNVVSDRVSEYTERVVQVASGTAADLEDHRRLTERGMGDLRSGVARANAAIDALSASVESLAADIERVAGELGAQLERVTEEVQTLRRRTAVRPRTTARTEPEDDPPVPARRPTRRR